MRTTLLTVPIVTLSLMSSPRGVAHATPAVTSTRSVQIEVIERDGRGAHKTVRFSIALTEDHPPSQLEAHHGGIHYKLSVQARQRKKNTVVLRVELRRSERADRPRRGGPGNRDRGQRRRWSRSSSSFSISSRIESGKRVVLGSIDGVKHGPAAQPKAGPKKPGVALLVAATLR